MTKPLFSTSALLGSPRCLFSVFAALILGASVSATSAYGETARAVTAGMTHSCAVTSAGGVKCWGNNNYGQLGNGTETYSTTPADVVGLSSGVAAVGVGWHHSCAVTTVGGVQCWGRNDYGQLGDGTTEGRSTPIGVSGLSTGVAAIAAGFTHTCALTTSGGIKCWGANYAGQLGDGTTTARLTPEDVTDLSAGVKAITTGSEHNCALTTGGGVKCWGYNSSGGLGDGTSTNGLTPGDVIGLSTGVAAISAAYEHSCAVTTAGSAKCWGHNSDGQVGDGTTTDRLAPVDVTGLSAGVAGIGAGYFHSCALTTSGGVKCWGANHGGQVGDGTTTSHLTPVNVSGLGTGTGAVAGGGYHTCAVTTAGGVRCWGHNGSGQVGDGTATDRWIPATVSGFEDAAHLPAADYDGDGRADVAVYRRSTGVWYIVQSSTGVGVAIPWGAAADIPVPADYDGDGRTDVAVYRPSTGVWWIIRSTTGAGVAIRWGTAGDVPVPADYDGDGRADPSVFRPSNGVWYQLRSTTGMGSGVPWGTVGDVPVPADYDGDGKADPTVFRPMTGTWWQLRSTTGTGVAVRWGQNGDTPLAGDYDGDGKADPTIFRAGTGTWYQLRTGTGAGYAVQWGTTGDLPIVGDCDGDGRADPTVFRPSTGTWYQLRSLTGIGVGLRWGTWGDLPL